MYPFEFLRKQKINQGYNGKENKELTGIEKHYTVILEWAKFILTGICIINKHVKLRFRFFFYWQAYLKCKRRR
jgi:hypothetical protein